MFKNILVPTDGTPLSDRAINAAIELARNNPGCKIIGLSVADPVPQLFLETYPEMDLSHHDLNEQILAKKRAEKIAEYAKAAGIPCETIVKQSAIPHEEIINTAMQYDTDCIFMTSRGTRGACKFFLGSETQKVLKEAKIPVLVYR